jgi:ATP-dependent helicase Lhr and Lhr-like helicase
VPGDSFVFAGEVLRFEGLRETDAIVTRAHATDPKVPSYEGSKFPLSTYLADRVRRLLADPGHWARLPEQVSDWLRLQSEVSIVPGPDEILVETFPRGKKHYLVCYPFEGRLAHQSLGMLLTRRLERAHARPLGFVANEYALAVWGLADMGEMVRSGRLDLATLFDEDMLGDDLDAWLAESNLMKRSFRVCAIIAGLIERRHPGKEKTGRQMTVSSDLIYEVLRQHEPDHISVAGRLRRRRDWPHRRRALKRLFAANPRKNQAYSVDACLAARGAGDARDRPGKRPWGRERGLAARGDRGADSGGDGGPCCA